jgi:hypothetical protein
VGEKWSEWVEKPGIDLESRAVLRQSLSADIRRVHDAQPEIREEYARLWIAGLPQARDSRRHRAPPTNTQQSQSRVTRHIFTYMMDRDPFAPSIPRAIHGIHFFFESNAIKRNRMKRNRNSV